MKKASFLTIAMLTCATAFAGPVTQEEALLRATRFMAARSHATATKGMRLAKRQPTLTQVPAAQTAYYVFNMDADGDGGFVIVSGDDRTPPILGYADGGHFDEATLPPNMKAWLDGYARQMATLGSTAAEADGDNNLPQLTPLAGAPQLKAPSVRHSVTPLLTTQWDQMDPYNQKLLDPRRYPGVKCATGCVATAMAQLMKYHATLTGKLEATTAEVSAYITPSNGYRIDGVAKGTRFDWGNMLDTYVSGVAAENSSQQAQIDAVAELMHACGAAVQMDYASMSQANTFDVSPALKQYFGFDDATRFVRRADYTVSQWNNLIYGELTENRPVFFAGSSSSNGHAFIIDGFDGDELFHINWGWGGHCNGYYLLTLANPTDKQGTGAGDSDDGYNMDQLALIGAQPDDGIPYDDTAVWLTYSKVSVDGNMVIFSAHNHFEKTAVFELGLGYFDDAGNIQPTNIIFSSGGGIPPEWGYEGVSFQITSLTAKAGDPAKLALISREAGTTEWLTQMNPDDYYIEAKKVGSTYVLTLVRPELSLKVEKMAGVAAMKAMHTHKVDVTISNSGKEFYGSVHFISQRMGYPLKDTLTVGATVMAGQATTVQFPFRPPYEGRFEVMIAAGGDGGGVFYKDTLEVADGWVSNKVPLGVELKIANLNTAGKAILGSKAQVVATVTNDTDTDFEGLFVVLLIEPGRYTFSLDAIRSFGAHTTTVVEEEFDVAENKQYMPVCHFGDPQATTRVMQTPNVAYSVEPAVTVYMADGTHRFVEIAPAMEIPDSAVAVEIMDAKNIRSVKPGANPNCLYYLREGAAKPEGLADNTIIGSHAERLLLRDDGLPFTPIAAFTAGEASYTRKFDNGVKAVTDELGTAVLPCWTTICLPFQVERCLIGEKVSVDWMHQVDDTDYNFWLMEYKGDENNTLFFAPADTMKAYTPYLIAVPSANLKGLHDMTAQPVTFCGSNAAISTGTTAIAASSNYKFVGAMTNVEETGWAYNIQDDGMMCHRDNVKVQPFRAYIKAMSNSTHTVDVPISMAATIQVEAEINASVKGDVNGDGTVDVADISAVISIMAGIAQGEWALMGDVNDDGSVDVADISAIIGIMAQ